MNVAETEEWYGALNELIRTLLPVSLLFWNKGDVIAAEWNPIWRHIFLMALMIALVLLYVFFFLAPVG